MLKNARPTSPTETPHVVPADAPIVDWVRIVRGEYLEIPGLRLTRPQVQRLWGLDPVMCDALLGALVDARFLRRTSTDAYVRADAA
jgi:hypothetical protein